MWASILKIFSDSPSQTKVVKFLLENGFGINESGKIICNGIEIPATHLGKATGTDRRVVDATAKRILETSLVREIFLNMRATPDITEIADKLNFAVITIYPKDAGEKGIVGAAIEVLTRHNLSIRQIFVTDPQLSEDPRLVIIVEKSMPAAVYEELRALPQVRKIVL
ncbi:MAG: regulator of amino acid metabolism, contains ACT domain protein [Methanomicrobium sp.]|nr:regulator of amino acid metabolism, contains ACT domain protein [Methanomicrobium sp.]